MLVPAAEDTASPVGNEAAPDDPVLTKSQSSITEFSPLTIRTGNVLQIHILGVFKLTSDIGAYIDVSDRSRDNVQ